MPWMFHRKFPQRNIPSFRVAGRSRNSACSWERCEPSLQLGKVRALGGLAGNADFGSSKNWFLNIRSGQGTMDQRGLILID